MTQISPISLLVKNLLRWIISREIVRFGWNLVCELVTAPTHFYLPLSSIITPHYHPCPPLLPLPTHSVADPNTFQIFSPLDPPWTWCRWRCISSWSQNLRWWRRQRWRLRRRMMAASSSAHLRLPTPAKEFSPTSSNQSILGSLSCRWCLWQLWKVWLSLLKTWWCGFLFECPRF